MFSPQFFVSVITILIAFQTIMLCVAYAVMLERKIAAWVQDRIGPNRAGFDFGQEALPKFHFWGLGQPIADGIKLFLKEDYTPRNVEKQLFLLAPILATIPAVIAFAIIPWGGYWYSEGWVWPSFLPLIGGETVQPFRALTAGAPINIGILYVLAVGSLAVYGIVVGGYASNNKYSFLGGLRATAQMLSYEIPMGLAVLIVILMTGTLRVDTIIDTQAAGIFNWNILWMPFIAVIFFTCQLAEANRTPFDLAECEQELVGGFHTEFSSMKFALYFLDEYMHIITAAAIFTLLFLGGFDIPFIAEPTFGPLWLVLLHAGMFMVKIFLVVCVVMLIRWTIPRFRFDQLMKLAWRSLIPVMLVFLLCGAAIQYMKVTGMIGGMMPNILMLVANIAVFAGVILVGPMLPQGEHINRKVKLAGSRFNAPEVA